MSFLKQFQSRGITNAVGLLPRCHIDDGELEGGLHVVEGEKDVRGDVQLPFIALVQGTSFLEDVAGLQSLDGDGEGDVDPEAEEEHLQLTLHVVRGDWGGELGLPDELLAVVDDTGRVSAVLDVHVLGQGSGGGA